MQHGIVFLLNAASSTSNAVVILFLCLHAMEWEELLAQLEQKEQQKNINIDELILFCSKCTLYT